MSRCDKRATAGLVLPLAVAFVLWTVMFGLRWGNFWAVMSLSAVTLALWASVWEARQLGRLLRWRWIWLPLGFALAAGLYGMFWLGNEIAGFLLPTARAQVAGVYSVRGHSDPRLIGMALVFLIAPAEEIFWRGFVQGQLERCWLGRWWAVVAGAAVYAGVHVWSGNGMLLGAALTGGLFWGTTMALSGSLWPGIISHAVWDVAIFLIWPIGG